MGDDRAVDGPIYVVGHRHPDTDSVASAIAYAHLKQQRGEVQTQPARAGELNSETAYLLQRVSVPVPELLTDGRGRRLILVDHNEVAQAVDHVRDATVLEVWEHHRVGDLEVPQPIVFHCEPVGATATLIAEQYFLQQVDISPAIATLLLGAILSDTLGFASPTCTEKDRSIARRLETLAGVEAIPLGRELLAARGDPASRSARELVDGDFKEFTFGGHRVGIGQVEAADAAPLLVRRDEILAELRRTCAEKGLWQVLLMVTDIQRRGSFVWCVGSGRDVVEHAFGQAFADGAAWVEGCMSRKKQVVPLLEATFARQAPPGSVAAER